MITRIANSPRLLVLTAGVVLAVAALAYSLTEGAGIGDSLYWSIVTATTVGYGDLLPKAGLSKVVSVALMFFSVFFLVPMITAGLASKLITNRDAFTHEEQEELKSLLRRTLAEVDEIDGMADA